MRMSVIINKEDRTQYYRTGVFRRHEDLVVFPFWEFEAFYQDLKHLRQLVSNVLEYGQSGQRGYTPEDGIVYAQNYLERMEELLDGLNRYQVQTEIESFPEIRKKETPQCLLGL
ncbi:hypothetical protein FGU46_07830 [Methanobacterium sp. CWC-01]|jgi:hypothetical protein|uniref:hypothetical protein n=1 Tax=Methanobacterium aridiramus TaxID=2584467 RepID=UPI002575924E|nr:hypothetical protein [Methanobacterium sp. CWC-01]WJI10003.1 hypothetical protein FGU46_07830 [Methanobacterium sp. CWC-01]